MSPTADVEDRVKQARKTISSANRKAAKLREDPEVNRTTRARNALIIKADALDQVGLILAGKA